MPKMRMTRCAREIQAVDGFAAELRRGAQVALGGFYAFVTGEGLDVGDVAA